MDEEKIDIVPAKKRRTGTPVTVVWQNESAALVEWYDPEPHRAYVPLVAIEGGTVQPEVLAEGTPGAIEWGKYLKPRFTAKAVTQALWRQGIYSVSDLREKLPLARQVVAEMYNATVIDMLLAVEAEQEVRKNG